MIEAIGVVVPARDEEVMLPQCLDALAVATRAAAPMPVSVVVVLDSCSDRSAEVVAARPWVAAMRVEVCNVGLARRAGTEELLRRFDGIPPEAIWLATTDADSVVPGDWLTGQLALAADGWEAVVGTVSVADWSERDPLVASLWRASYSAIEHHPHVHGANLAFTAEAYLDAGGWPALAAHEDVALLRRFRSRRVVSTATLAVVTSARQDPRATGGFGDALSGLAG